MAPLMARQQVFHVSIILRPTRICNPSLSNISLPNPPIARSKFYPSKANEQPAELNLDNCLAVNGCIEKGKICIINGTACCAGTTCKGKFPNTYCN